MRDASPVFSYRAELLRKALHVFALVMPVGIVLIDRSITLPVLGALAVVALVADVARHRVRPVYEIVNAIFAPIMRPEEKPPFGGPIVFNGATWMCTSAALCVLVLPATIAAASLAILMVGDAFAAIVGRRWGRIRYPWSDKSLEGSIAFVVTGWLIALPFGLAGDPVLGPGLLLLGAVISAAVEAVPLRINDNVLVPLAAGLVMLAIAG